MRGCFWQNEDDDGNKAQYSGVSLVRFPKLPVPFVFQPRQTAVSDCDGWKYVDGDVVLVILMIIPFFSVSTQPDSGH